MTIPTYSPNDWYWKVGQTPGVFHSARAAYVADNDAAYEAWFKRTAPIPATKIESEESLWEVLGDQFPAGLPLDVEIPESSKSELTKLKEQVEANSAKIAELETKTGNEVAPAEGITA